MKRIAIYGKGGIGKSTTVCNIAAAMAQQGLRVLQLGCDPKADSTSAHLDGVQQVTILDTVRTKGDNFELSEIIREGKDGVLCAECGGPIPGSGCAGRGIVTAFDTLTAHNAYEIYKPDVVLYDVLGDVVCGGFAMPLRNGYARDVFIVTSGEKMALYAAANIAMAIGNFKGRNYARLTGLIQNSRNVKRYKTIMLALRKSSVWLVFLESVPYSEFDKIENAEQPLKNVEVNCIHGYHILIVSTLLHFGHTGFFGL